MKATITPHGITDEFGNSWELLGTGERYGFDSVYTVRKTGSVKDAPIPATTMGWPWNQNEIWIEQPQRHK